MGRYLIQDPADKLFHQNDWTDWLASGDTIASRVWTLDPDESPSLLENATSETVTVKAGLDLGTTYRLTEEITTANGEIGNRSITIRCEKR